jgi:hypothetical protein
VDTIHRTDIYAGSVFGVNTGLRYNIRHSMILL